MEAAPGMQINSGKSIKVFMYDWSAWHEMVATVSYAIIINGIDSTSEDSVSSISRSSNPRYLKTMTVGYNDATNFPSTNMYSTLEGILNSIKNNYAKKTEIPTAQANAVSSLFLKDTNDQVYEITVDTNGTLTATAVNNS